MLITVNGNPNYDAVLGTKIIRTIVTVTTHLNCVNTQQDDSESGHRSRNNSESGSASRLGAMNNSSNQIETNYRQPQIANLEQILRIFYQLADFESAIAMTKEKEISS